MLFFATSGCGKHAGIGGPDDIQGIVISGSAYAGMVLAATAVDQSVRTSIIYYYDFTSGSVHQLLDAESADPALYWADGRVFLFNRTPGQKNVRTFDPRQTGTPLPDPLPLDSLTSGDPWDVATLVTGHSVVVAEPLGGALEALDYTTGVLTPVPKPVLASKALRPHALMRVGEQIFALHSGVDSSGNADGSQQVYVLAVAADGTLSFVGQGPSPTPVAGLPVAPTNPTGFVNQDGQGGATIVGLCMQDWTQCTAGAARLAAGKSVAPLTGQAFTGLYYQGQVVDGPTDQSVYAHVGTGKDQPYKIVRIDLADATTSDIVVLPDDRLYNVAYDRSSQDLFVGGIAAAEGSLTLYHGDQLTGSFDLSGVPYASVFVPK